MSASLVLVVAIGPFLLSGAEVQQSLYVAGTPGPTAVAGVGHALVRKWRASGMPALKDRGTSLLLDPIREHRGRARGMTQASVPEPALPDEVRANFRAMLLVAISLPDDPITSPREAVSAALSLDGWALSLVGQRAFGGVMLPLSCPDQIGIPLNVAVLDAAGEWLRLVPRGSRLMVMAGDSGEALPEEPVEGWQARPLAQALRRHMIVRGKDESWRRLVKGSGGILRPAHVGYACLGSLEVRMPGRRGEGDYPHRFVQPVIGSVVWRRPTRESLPDSFWSHHRPSDGLFVVRAGNPTTNPSL